jgi:5-deoxy-5-amino-3-dehydroquinate synthase
VIKLEVPLADRTYPVLVGDGARHDLASVLPAGAQRAAIVTQAAIGVQVESGLEQQQFLIGEGESEKSLSTVETLCRGFAEFGMTRRDVVVAVGGGLVTDVGGFAAACYHRGIAVVHVSTTLLGQIDASIGGKTGVNLPGGKNLVGAFWQPSGVICDTELLATLPPREMRSGLGELAKYHFLGGGDLDSLPLDERVAACVQIKADVVASDEREGGRRAILNYGHTLAHALEIAGSFDLRHGEAVAVGLLYAAELAHLLGRISAERVAEHRRVLGAYDLPSNLPPGTNHDEVISLFARDKKALDGITFVLDGPAGVEVVTGVSEGRMREALERISSTTAPKDATS